MTDPKALVDCLVAACSAPLFDIGVREVLPYDGQLAEDYKQVISRLPACWVAHVMTSNFDRQGNRISEDIELEVWIGDKTYTGKPGSALTGSHTGPGTYKMVKAVRHCLDWKVVSSSDSGLSLSIQGRNLGELRPITITAMPLGDVSLYRLIYKITLFQHL